MEYFPVMIGKIFTRIREPGLKNRTRKAKIWAEKESLPLSEVLKEVDSKIQYEAHSFYKKLSEYGKNIEENLPVKMGAGGNCFLLYFLCKKYKPSVIVETGVSMGYSSQTILTAIKENGIGHLYSSDFPYFRLENPEQYIGCVVEESLKNNWTLKISGDRRNLPEIIEMVDKIDLFHFDSDKSIAGREFAWKAISPFLKDDSTAVFDDIIDNLHFKSIYEEFPEKCLVVHDDIFGGYVGVIGRLALDFRAN